MNYGELKTAVAGYLHRNDVTPMMPTFLQLAENRIYIGEQNAPALRVSAMRKTQSLTTGALPSDFIEAWRVGDDLRYTTRDQIDYAARSYAFDSAVLILSKDQRFPLDLTYYTRFTTPVLDADTNWLLTNAPNVYLTAILVEAARWARDDALGPREAANYISAVNALMSADKAAQMSGSRLTLKHHT